MDEEGIMKILLGVEDSKFSGSAWRAIVAQFRPETTEVRVLHVLQPIVSVAPPEMAQGYVPEIEGQRKPAHELVARIAEELHKAGFKVDTAVKIGDVRVGIIDCATQWGADLIVVGSHGQGGIPGFLLGSVAESVARHAKCSVEIVRAPVKA
jgi:nucleotide-binding universal stress UspA family protein